jgi:hypothetical protein
MKIVHTTMQKINIYNAYYRVYNAYYREDRGIKIGKSQQT